MASSSTSTSLTSIDPADWVIHNLDPETCDPPSIETEVRRLQVLKSYHLLDRENLPCYTRLVAITAKLFNVKYAFIKLIDLGRYFVLSSVGMPDDFKEGPRKSSMCSHAIQCRHPTLEVKDCREDYRFKGHPSVIGEPFVRFYAAAPLTSPEGYKIGTLCIMDEQPRELTEDERRSFINMAESVMDIMEEKRITLQAGVNQHTGITYSIDVQRSITFLRQQLKKLRESNELQTIISDRQRSWLQSASDSAQFLYTSLVPKQQSEQSKRAGKRDNESHREISPSPGKRRRKETQVGQVTDVDMTKFVKSLDFVMESFPKDVNLSITVDPNLPDRVYFNDLKIFRSTIALLTSACERTKVGYVKLSIFLRASGETNQDIVFECEDTGSDVDLDHYPQLFLPPDNISDVLSEQDCISLGPKDGIVQGATVCGRLRGAESLGDCFAVHAVAQYIGSSGGEYGFRPRTPEDSLGFQTGSVFWFSIPLRLSHQPDGVTTSGSSSGRSSVPESLSTFHKFENTISPRPQHQRTPSWLT